MLCGGTSLRALSSHPAHPQLQPRLEDGTCGHLGVWWFAGCDWRWQQGLLCGAGIWRWDSQEELSRGTRLGLGRGFGVCALAVPGADPGVTETAPAAAAAGGQSSA